MPDKLYVGLGKHETTSLQGIAKRAQACKQHRFQDLYGLVDERLLHECWCDLNKMRIPAKMNTDSGGKVNT